jgi:hypothetical protein
LQDPQHYDNPKQYFEAPEKKLEDKAYGPRLKAAGERDTPSAETAPQKATRLQTISQIRNVAIPV